jgi:hypothetical protein
MKIFVLALAIGLCANLAQANTPGCVVQTFTGEGQYLATVLTADGKALTPAEAEQTAQLLNARHNNGSNPVVAHYFCSK